jgi:hypothetical protein
VLAEDAGDILDEVVRRRVRVLTTFIPAVANAVAIPRPIPLAPRTACS